MLLGNSHPAINECIFSGNQATAGAGGGILCLNADPTALTCIGNDYGFDEVFARQCTALAGPADALIVFSTSGRSTNIIKALQAARDNAATTIGLLGGDGGGAAELCDHVLMAPGSDSASIQECHQVALHAICNCLEP